MNVSKTPNNDLLKSFLKQHHPACPGCGQLLAVDTRCSECGRLLSLSLEVGHPFSIPFLFAFTPWLFVLGAGLFSWLGLISILLAGTLDRILSAISNVHSAVGILLILFTELTLLASPVVVFMLWSSRRQIPEWSFKFVFFIGLIPLLAFLFRLFSAAGFYAA